MPASPMITIIVPVYNTEQYLRSCLDSLFRQGLNVSDYEIILVNDGLTDKSYEICKEYKERYQNIVLLSQTNQGVSAARNYGLSQAKGEWICFVDSDDYMVGNSLKYIYEHFVGNACDVIRFWAQFVTDNKVDKAKQCDGELCFEGDGFEFIKRYGLDTFCYIYLIRRSFLIEHEIYFKPFRLGEDFLFASTLLLANPRVRSTSCLSYLYLIHPQTASTTRSKEHSRKAAIDHLIVNALIASMIEPYKSMDIELYNKCLESLQVKIPLIFSRLLCSDISVEDFGDFVREQKRLGVLPVNYKSGGTKMKVSQWMINILSANPSLFSLARFVFSHFFVPYILPLLDRNK